MILKKNFRKSLGNRLAPQTRSVVLPLVLAATSAQAQEAGHNGVVAAPAGLRQFFPSFRQASGVCLSLKLLRRSTGRSRSWFMSNWKPSR